MRRKDGYKLTTANLKTAPLTNEEYQAARLEIAGTEILKRPKVKKKVHKQAKTRIFGTRTKAQRQAWWRNLTDDQREAYITKKNAQKAKKRQGQPSNCPVYGPWDETNKHIWREKVLRQNPWLPDDIFDREVSDHEYQENLQMLNHLNSITANQTLVAQITHQGVST